ncbi:membrane protein containing DUF477 [Candidatus Omnitrophus magneticus]|uniref:Membrane protein containing DUF477 n=1 Tax=Candidatus Omnitrophus magneticus TaxID=1609969 RepID=A0A0F0CRR6_9BACT|nr:membrane protein containing DUF477 [Candidatus Omnitrophus magneticus]
MKFKKIFLIISLIIFGMFIPSLFSYSYKFQAPSGSVNDYAEVISENASASISKILNLIKEKTSVEIAVVTVKDTAGVEINEYAVELYKSWGIGKKGEDNGILVLMAINDRKCRIEVGYGMEGIVTDAYSKIIIDELMIPHFKKGDFDGGILSGVVMLSKIIKEAYGVELDIKMDGVKTIEEVPLAINIVRAIVLFFVFIFVFGVRFGPLFYMGETNTRRSHWGNGGYGHFGGGSGSFGGGFGGFGGGASGGGGSSGSW